MQDGNGNRGDVGGSQSRSGVSQGGVRVPGTLDELWRQVVGVLAASGAVYGHGTLDAGDEAAWLVSHVIGRDPVTDPWPGTMKVDVSTVDRALALAYARVESRRPLAYLIGEAWFAGRRYHVDERVLVPRSPIAELIGDRFSPWVEPDRVRRVLDLCAGSGCIGIACAHAFPGARVDLGELSPGALEVAETNIRVHEVGDRVRAVESDLYAAFAGESYDVIVSNPPYVDVTEMVSLAEEYRHEPGIGLYGGEDGLEFVRRILSGAAAHLNPGGILVVEVGNSEAALVESMPDLPFTWLEFEFGGHGVFLLEAGQLPGRRDRA